MAENTLDDLILTDSEPEKGKSKGMLALLALVILLIIVGAILAKMIFSSPDDLKGKKSDANNSAIATTIADTNSAANNLNANTTMQPLDPDLAPIDETNDSMEATVQTVSVDESKNKTQTTTPAPQTAKKPIAEKPAAEQRVKKQEKETVKKSVAKVHHPKPQHIKRTYGGSGNVYIQVGSFKQGPESGFISKIRRAGFKFRIKETNGYRRVYVGPFRTRDEAKSLLNIVKSKIAPNAFVK